MIRKWTKGGKLSAAYERKILANARRNGIPLGSPAFENVFGQRVAAHFRKRRTKARRSR